MTLLVLVLAAIAVETLATSDMSTTVYDERRDVRGGTGGEALSHTEVDILKVSVTDEMTVNSYDFDMELAGDQSPDAVYTLHLLIDGAHEAWLELREGDNWTGSDSRGQNWAPTGATFSSEVVMWNVPIATVNATRSVRVLEATATIVTEDSKTFTDECSWDLTDVNKGLVDIEMWYRLLDGETIERDVRLSYFGQAAAGFRYSVDIDGDYYLTQDEIDLYLEELETVANGTDMSMQFNQHTSRILTMTVFFDPGPLHSDRFITIDSKLVLKYPPTRAREIYYAWELELEGHFGIPYYRASDDSFFKITTPTIRKGEVYRFGQWDLTPVTEQFYLHNFTMFFMNGSQLRAHWNTTMRDAMGFSLFAEDLPPDPNETWCDVTNIIVLMPAGFVAVSAWRGADRHRRR